MNCSCHYLFLQVKCWNNVNVKAKYSVTTACLHLLVFQPMLERVIRVLALMRIIKILNIAYSMN